MPSHRLTAYLKLASFTQMFALRKAWKHNAHCQVGVFCLPLGRLIMRETVEKKFGFGSGIKTIHLQFLDRPWALVNNLRRD